MFSGVKAAFCSLGLRQSRLTKGERVCTHHEFCREQIALDPVLDCDGCFFGLLQTISLAPSSATTGGLFALPERPQKSARRKLGRSEVAKYC